MIRPRRPALARPTCALPGAGPPCFLFLFLFPPRLVVLLLFLFPLLSLVPFLFLFLFGGPGGLLFCLLFLFLGLFLFLCRFPRLLPRGDFARDGDVVRLAVCL